MSQLNDFHINKNNAGFTLLEVLIAIAIFSVISLSSFTIFNTVLSSSEKSKERNERINELQRAFLIIERDFTQIARRKVRMNGEGSTKGYIHTQDSSFSSSTQALGFVRHGWSNPGLAIPRSDLQTVGYQLEEGILQRIHFTFVDPILGEEPKVRSLITGVEELRFEFHDGKEWREDIDETGFPVAIAIEITTEDFGEIRRQYLTPGESTVGINND